MRVVIPCPDVWLSVPMYDLAWTFSRINPHAPPVKIERSNDGYSLILTFLQEKK